MITTRSGSEPLHDIRSDYEISKQNGRFRRPRRGVGGVGTSADYHFRSESDWLYSIEYARDLDRNDVFSGMCLDRLIDNILQETGCRPDPDTGDDQLDAILKDDWREWAEDATQCDLMGERTFREIERTVLRSMLVDGDHFVLPTKHGSLELIEAHRCRTPSNTRKNVVYGVHLNNKRQRLNYLFTKEELSPYKKLRRVGDTRSVPAVDADGFKQVFHVYNPHRLSQTRGVSAFHRIGDAIGMHDDIQFANLVRQQIASCFALIREQTMTPPTPGGVGNGYGNRITEQVSNDYSRTLENISPGMQVKTNPGEKITGFSPNVPNPQYFEHVSLILKLISANLGIPMIAVLLDASQTNFSGWRGAIDQARAGFRRVQTHLIDRMHKHVYWWRVSELLDRRDDLKSKFSENGIDPYRVRWKRPTWEYIEPVKDTTADVSQIRGLITSPRRVSNRRGEEHDEIRREIIEDNTETIRQAKIAAAGLNEEFPEDTPVSWREVLVLPLHDGLQVSLGNSPEEQEATQKASEKEGA